jgi:hypothetical protein
MFADFISRILEREREFVINRQEKEITTPDVIEEKSSMSIPKRFKEDIEALEKKSASRFLL